MESTIVDTGSKSGLVLTDEVLFEGPKSTQKVHLLRWRKRVFEFWFFVEHWQKGCP